MASFTVYAVLFLALTRFTSAQISGIDAVTTSPDQYGHPQCTIANFTSVALGVANFSSQVSESRPLTWTVALSDAPDNSNKSQLLYDRNYILGVPSTTDIVNSTSVYGCGLFFEGMTPLLSFPGTNNNESATGTCADALSAGCVNDMIKLAQSEGQKLQQSQGNDNSSSICTTLQERISVSPPESCRNIPRDAWRNILARDLTGSSVAPPLKESSCHPTTGKDYTVSLIASYRRVSAPEYNLIMPFETGVTPIVTAFFNLGSAAAPNVQLTCLRALTSNANQTNDTGSSPSESSAVGLKGGIGGSLLGFVGFVGFVGVLWQMFA